MIIAVKREGRRYEFELAMQPLRVGTDLALETHSAQTELELHIKAVLGDAATKIAKMLEGHLANKRIG